MDYENLKAAVRQAIKQNDNQEITGNLLQSTLLNIVDTIEAGLGKNFNKELIFDVSAYNNGAAFESLQALLSSSDLSTLIPTSVRHGGMSIRFIQSSDNKYVQYRLMSDSFNTTVANWQGVDDVPTARSENLVKSGGVYEEVSKLSQKTNNTYNTLYGDYVFQPKVQDLEVGMLDSSGNNYPHTERIRTKIYIPAQEGDILVNIYDTENYKTGNQGFNIFEYDKNYSLLRSSKAYVKNNYTCGQNCAYIRFFFSIMADPTITDEIIAAHYNEFYLVYKQRYSRKNNQKTSFLTNHLLKDFSFCSHKVRDFEFEYGYLDDSNGKKITDTVTSSVYYSRIRTSEYISVTPGDIFRVPTKFIEDGYNIRIYYYDKNYNFLGLSGRVTFFPYNERYHFNENGYICQTIDDSNASYVHLCIDDNNNNELAPSNFDEIVEHLYYYDEKIVETFKSHKQEQYLLKEFNSDNDNINLSNYLINCACWDSGNLVSAHLGNGFATKLIAVAPFSELVITNMAGIIVRIETFEYYNSNVDKKLVGEYTYSNTIKKVLREKENYVSFSFWKSNHSNFTEQELISGVTINLNTSHVCIPYSEKIENEFVNKKVLFINDYTSWKLGTANKTSSLETNKCDTNKPIKVIPGHRYVIDWFESSGICVGVTGSAVDTAAGVWLGWQNYSYMAFIDIPNSINYIRLTALKTDITIQDCVDANVKLIDVTTPPYHLAGSYQRMSWLKLGSYAQGMAIQNGFVFQAFADGTIEVRNMNNGQLVDTINVPTPTGESSKMHCNNLTFGPKQTSSDEFGLLWLASNNIGTKMVACKITRYNDDDFSLEVIYEITAPSIDSSVYKAVTQFYDFAQNKMLQVAYYDDGNGGYGDVHIFGYKVSSWDDSAQFTQTTDFKVSKMWAMQGGVYQDNRLYILAGTEGSSARINVFDITVRQIEFIIDLRKSIYGLSDSEELQGIAFYDGDVFVSTSLWKNYPNDAYCNLYKVLF